MLDWLRYFPLALRHSNQPTVPRGPYFPWLLQHKWQFSDTFFFLNARPATLFMATRVGRQGPCRPSEAIYFSTLIITANEHSCYRMADGITKISLVVDGYSSAPGFRGTSALSALRPP